MGSTLLTDSDTTKLPCDPKAESESSSELLRPLGVAVLYIAWMSIHYWVDTTTKRSDWEKHCVAIHVHRPLSYFPEVSNCNLFPSAKRNSGPFGLCRGKSVAIQARHSATFTMQLKWWRAHFAVSQATGDNQRTITDHCSIQRAPHR